MAMTLRLTEDQDRLLQQLADSQGISKQEAAVRAIENATRERAAARAAVLGRIVAEDAELLDLLAKVTIYLDLEDLVATARAGTSVLPGWRCATASC